VFARFDLSIGNTVIYTVNPDGTDLRALFTDFAEFPHWSPDGTRIATIAEGPDGAAIDVFTAPAAGASGSAENSSPPFPPQPPSLLAHGALQG
jgi:Tol biopolymer transport system component